MAGERSELAELRRIDELEKRASAHGQTVTDPLTAGPAGVAAEMPEWERRAAGVGRAMSAPVEAVQQLIGHLTGHGQEADFKAQENARLMGPLYKASAEDTKRRGGTWNASRLNTATDVTGAALTPAAKIPGVAGTLGRIGSMGLTGGLFGAAQPVTSGKDFATEKTKQAVEGGIGAMTVSQAVRALTKSPGLLRGLATRFGLIKEPVEPLKPVGQGATEVTRELQQQRDVQAGRAEPRTEGGSQYERAKVDFDERMKPLREEAFRGAPVSGARSSKLIDDLLAKNPDAKVQAALAEVKATMERAAQGSQSAALPSAGTRMNPAELRALQGQGGNLSVPMLDEVRQSINRMISQTGEKALDKHTKDVLAQVRESLVKSSPESYQKYVQQFAKGAQDIDRLKPDVGATGKLTEGERGAQTLSGADAQRAMNDVLGGKTSARDLKQIVEATKHSAGASTALRSSYKEWLVQRNSVGEIEAGKMLDRWTQSRDAVRESGLFDSTHFKNVDDLMHQLREGYRSKKAYTQAGNMLGWFMSGYRGAYLGRTVGGKLAENVERDVEGRVVNLIMDNPQAAALLVKPRTAANINKLSEIMGKAEARRDGEQPTPRRTTANPMSMTPPGVPKTGTLSGINGAFTRPLNPGPAPDSTQGVRG